MKDIIYEYGCRPDAESAQLAGEHLWKAHVLYNNIVAVIRSVRNEVHEFLLSKCPEARALQNSIDEQEEAFKSARAIEDVDAMAAAKAAKTDAYKRLRDALKPVRAAHKADTDGIYARIGARAQCETYRVKVQSEREGLLWCTSGAVLDAALKAWQKVSKDGGQVQFRKIDMRQQDHLTFRFCDSGGVPFETLFDRKADGASRHARVSLSEPGVETEVFTAVARPRYIPGFKFQVAPAKANQFVTGTVTISRMPPAGSRVTEVRLVRKRIGPQTKWSIQLALKIPEAAAPRITPSPNRRPMAALHFGWSLSDEGLRRVAALCDEADSGLAEFIDIPADIGVDLARSEMKGQERDKNRDAFVEQHLRSNVRTTGWTEATREELEALRKLPAQHVAPSRLRRLSWALEDIGLPWEALKRYAIEDRWLHQEQRSIYRCALNRRKDFYRCIAKDLVQRYEVLVLAMPSLKDAAKRRKDDGERSDLGQMARKARTQAALYEFKQCLLYAADRAGAHVIEHPDMQHVHACSVCGNAVQRDWDLVRCSDCGQTSDAKANAAAALWQSVEPTYLAEVARIAALAQSMHEQAQARKATKLLLQQEKRRANMDADRQAA